MIIKQIWYEDGKIFIHTDIRTGLLYFPIGKKFAWCLASVSQIRIKKIPRNEGIYELKDIKDAPPGKDNI